MNVHPVGQGIYELFLFPQACYTFATPNQKLMESNRQKKVGRLIQKELGEIFRKESLAHFEGKMITVTVVRVTADLSMAKVYLSIFPKISPADFNRLFEEKTKFIRHQLSQKIRNQVRIIPELNFYMDDSLDYIDNIERLLNND